MSNCNQSFGDNFKNPTQKWVLKKIKIYNIIDVRIYVNKIKER